MSEQADPRRPDGSYVRDGELHLAQPSLAHLPRGPMPPLARVLTMAVACAIAATALLLGTAYTREPPPPLPEALGLTIVEDSIKLAPDAPQWRVLRIAPAGEPQTRWSETIPARVRIVPGHSATVGTPISGRVGHVRVELGEPVKAGEPLFTLVSPALSELRAERDRARLDLQAAQVAYERIQAMVEAQALPAKEKIAAAQEVRQAELALQAAEAKLAALKSPPGEDISFDLVVTAPRDGVVVEKQVVDNQEVAPESGALIVVADLSEVWVVADLFEGEAAGVRAGTAARVTLPSMPEIEIEAPVELVSAVVHPDRPIVPVRIRVDNADRRLRPNVYAEVQLLVHNPPGTVEVPATAVITDGDQQYVYVQEESGRFTRRSVVTRAVRRGRVPIVRGLRLGEEVVVEGAILLDNEIHITISQ